MPDKAHCALSLATERALALESVHRTPAPAGTYAMDDETHPPKFISAHDFEIIRNAFKASVAGGMIVEQQWVQHAKDLIRALTGHEDPDEGIICRIIGR